ncbi:serine hydrolase FSH [Daldinia loculata]|uniref:serine hydrolase FSH n=1 Tax=Daldinia loculata TaxID=103429 RepID=UPI0020C4DB91|nr:serine hydrolase FSH [Daldinia loculata]KAI1647088.1 serine hydrolase FSH [Daldinia loculata]KAI2783828.1 serine hydrolase FSH [Daldinia loculata]
MRWLCLHGRGTSAQIFEMQTVRIREALGRDHEFVFVNGTVSTEPDVGADAIADEFFGYVAHDADQDRELCDNMIEFVESQGPFDGFMGFSEGGTVAAMMLVEDARHGSFGGIKCAVFFCAALPFDPDQARTGVIRYIDPDTDGVLLTIPTAHIWAQTAGAHEIKVHQSLTQICDDRVREVFLHDLGHDVPGAKSDKGLAGAVRAIEHVIENAMDSTR